jgi:BirA family transcriptional regulator, biotin operon repressor / biotin---[acetyl-CoA-carboxylase] ligase
MQIFLIMSRKNGHIEEKLHYLGKIALPAYSLNMKIHYVHLDTIDSTNNWVKSHLQELTPFTCVTAQEQTAGRGRLERHWVSPRGENIYASLYLHLPLGSSYLSNLGQIMAFACASILRELGFQAEIKWPNDIVVHRKKIGGVLTETVTLGEHIGVIIGIGLNVNMPAETLAAIDQPATSLLQLSKKKWDLQELTVLLMNHFLQNLELLKKSGFAPFQAPFESMLAYKGQEITCRDGTRTLKGICHSITKDGRLQLQLPSGEIKLLLAGEIGIS